MSPITLHSVMKFLKSQLYDCRNEPLAKGMCMFSCRYGRKLISLKPPRSNKTVLPYRHTQCLRSDLFHKAHCSSSV